MNTKYLTPKDAHQAAELLRSGGLVGIPTETVYGLGANGLDGEAVAKIFLAKGRPQDNPLILHIPEASWLTRYCHHIPQTAYRLAEAFWPGPMTMILPRKDVVPDAVTAGLETVGTRCPAHPLCREIIRLADVPVAAPSGNTSGRPSPTTAEHMREDMDGKIDAIVDGGPCRVGVESTIIDLTCTPPRLLRPGGITLEQLRSVLGEVDVDPAVTRLMGAGEKPKAPGMKYRHYAPKAPVTVVTGDGEKSAAYIADHAGAEDGIICFTEYTAQFTGGQTARPIMDLGPAADKAEQARRVFDALRAFDHTNVAAIWAQCPDAAGIGLAIANRLNKAAGFHIVEVGT
jgi:L-threonylcarbamoyladenylate synthase